MCICLWREKLNFHIYPSSQNWGDLSTTQSCHLQVVNVECWDAKSCLHTCYYDVKENIPKDYCPSDLKLMLSLSDAEKRSLPGPGSDGTRRIMAIYRLTLTKRWMTTASPTHCLHLLMMTWTVKTLIPLMNCYQLKHVAGQSRLMSRAITAHWSLLCSSSTEMQRRKQHSEYCSKCSQQKNRPCVVSKSSEAHTCLRGCGLFFNGALLHHDSFADVASLRDTLCGHTEETLRLTLVLGLYLLEM